MYGLGPNDQRCDLAATSIVFSRGLFATALSVQRVHVNDVINDPTKETTWQLGATYNFGWARRFGLYTRTSDGGLDVHSDIGSAAAAAPIRPGTVRCQVGFSRATGPAVDRRQSSASAVYLYAYDSVTDIYLVGVDDGVRGQTKGISAAAGRPVSLLERCAEASPPHVGRVLERRHAALPGALR
jgi:hypothetical protein